MTKPSVIIVSSFWSNSHITDVWNSRCFGLYIYVRNCSIRLNNDWNHLYETTDHLQQFRADKCSTFFKGEALRSPRLVKLKSFNFDGKSCNTSKGFRGPFLFIAFARKNDSFLSISSKSWAPFFQFFFLMLSIMCRRVFSKTIILLGLAGYEIYHFISSAPSYNNC